MLSKIKLTNFKSFTNKSLALRDLTVLTGLNSSGKSTIIQALRLLDKFQRTNNPNLEGHGYANEMINTKRKVQGYFEIIVSKSEEDFESEYLKLTVEANGFDDIKADMAGRCFFSCNYLSADRVGPSSFLPMNMSGDVDSTGDRGEYVIDFLGKYGDYEINSSLVHTKAEGITLRYNTEAWLSIISPGIKFSFKPEPEIGIGHSTFNNYRGTNVGFGLSYSLPVIVNLLSHDFIEDDTLEISKPILLIENPEAHLHPRGQTEMGKLLAMVANSGAQLIVETHSDHLIDGIRLAVKNQNIDNEKVIIHYFDLVNSESNVTSINLNSKGKMSHWPEGFFDQNMINKSMLADLD